MKKTFADVFTTAALVAMFALCSFGQTATPQCPKIEVSEPASYVVNAGEPITFIANLSGNFKVTPAYMWLISAGKITKGQGTSLITVDTTGIGGQSVTATVVLGRLAPECAITASTTTDVKAVIVAKKIDEYSSIISKADETGRLDNVANKLQPEPAGHLYVIAYGGPKSRPGDGNVASNRVKDYLVITRDIDAGRIITIDGGKRDKPTIEIWLVPIGAAPPEPTPGVVPSKVTPPKKKP